MRVVLTVFMVLLPLLGQGTERERELQVELALRRMAAQVGPVKRDPILERAAREHSEAMFRRGGKGSHDVGNGPPEARLRRLGYTGRFVGERIAWGWTPAQAMEFWMTDPEVQPPIPTRPATHFGIGEVGGYYTLILGVNHATTGTNPGRSR